MFQPAYLKLFHSGELKRRAEALKARLYNCDICPRRCRVDRYENNNGFCRSGCLARISSYCAHHGEEPALSGSRGSGTIFFSNCNLRCLYCQNFQISQEPDPTAHNIESMGLADVMLRLQEELDCHNINLVSPTHFVPQIIEALQYATARGLRLPLVFNTNGFDDLGTLSMLDGVVDIYLPDIKYASDEQASRFSQGKDYVKYNRAAIAEMFRQVGNLATDTSGVAQRGLIVRHLILPNDIAGSAESLEWLAKTVSPDVAVSIMSQYHPCYKAASEPLLARRISREEYGRVVKKAGELRLENGWLQEMSSADYYLPDFRREGHPFNSGQI